MNAESKSMKILPAVSDKPRILVVDDEPEIVNILVETFEMMGCEVKSVTDPTQVPAIFEKENFDLITLDYQMPGLSGKDLQDLLSKKFGIGQRRPLGNDSHAGSERRLPPILLITGFPNHGDVDALLFGEGIVGTIAKPFDIEEVQKTAQSALDHYRLYARGRDVPRPTATASVAEVDPATSGSQKHDTEND